MSKLPIQLTWPGRRLSLVIVLVFNGLFFVGQAFAADSEWLLGDDGKIAITTFEHRAADGASRETNVKLIIGANFLSGALRDVNEGPIKLVGTENPSYTFDGTISINYQDKQIKLKGKLKFSPTDSINLDTQFRCKELPGVS